MEKGKGKSIKGGGAPTAGAVEAHILLFFRPFVLLNELSRHAMDGDSGSGSDSDYNPEDTLPSSVRPSSSLTETEIEIEPQTAAETDLSSETAPPSSAPPPPPQQQQVEHTSTSTDPSPPATEIAPAPAPSHTITKPKSVKFADHHTEIPNPALRSPSPEYSGSNNETSDDNGGDDDGDGDKSPSEPIRVIDDNTGTVEVITPANDTTPDDIDIDVPLFNEIVQYYIASSFFQNEDFNALPPAEKETLIISEYCKSKEMEVDPKRVNLNFHATTSYNKPVLKQNDQIQLLVPINPFCKRPDITQPMDTDERYEFEEFKKDSDKYSKEFECLDFPPGSRLFIGNLAVNSLKISDVWRIFKQYGAVKAVNMKQGYGFVQFADSRACHVAIQGEEHVPLHNKLTQLQVSKTHEKHTENKHDAEKERDKYGRDRQRERERERSPKRANTNTNANANGNGNVNRKVRVIISLDSDAGFNHLLVNSLNEVGLKCNVKHVDTPADSVPQEAISESAYAGVCATLVTSKYELVNLFLFQRNQKDGAIKFDEYENISMESAINFIMKQVTEAARERDRSRSHARDRDGDKNRDRERQRGRHGDRGPRDRDSRDGRFARHSGERDRDRDRDRGHDRAWRDERTDRPVPTVNVSYSPTQQNEQKHLPPQITHPPPTAFSNLPTQPRARAQVQAQAQQQHPMPFYNAPVSQPQPQPQPPVNIASQLMNQLSSMDEASLKAMLQLVQSQGQGQAPPPLQNQGYPPPQGYPQQYPPAPAPMQPYPQQFTSPYPPQGYPAQGFAPQPQQPFSQMPSGSANGVGGLLAQLQGVPPGLAPAPASAPASTPAPVPVPAVEDDEDSTSRLFETLARLKNNM